MSSFVVNKYKENAYIPNIIKVTNQINSVHQKGKFALKKPFRSGHSNKLRNLINVYNSRRDFTELLTSWAVKRCQDRIEAEIASLNTGIIDIDVEEIYLRSESILREELFKRFRLNLPVQLIRTKNDYSDLNRLIVQYQGTKKRTLFITGLAEEWNRESWGQVIPRFISDPSLAWGVSHSDLNSVILKGLGINSDKEEQEYNAQMVRRVSGLRMAIQLGITQNIAAQAAEIFYQHHDRILDARLASTLNGLMSKQSARDGYQGEALNA